MRAFVCTQWGGPEVLTLGEAPSPECAPDEVIIKVQAWGVNSTDLVLIGGHYHLKPAFPFVPGMEVAGEVMEIGAGVSKFKVGDRVAVIVGMGGYAEYVAANESNVFALPADMGWAEAASFGMCYSTAYVGLVRRAQLRPGETLVVTGAAGGVGLAAVAMGNRIGANVIAAASTADKLSLAGRFGAAVGINYSNEDLPVRVKELTKGRGADVIYETVGGDPFNAALQCIAFEGRLVVIGFASMQIPQVHGGILLFGGFSVLGSSLYGTYQSRPDVVREMQATLTGWHAEKGLPSLVTKQLPFVEAPQALSLLSTRSSAGRIALHG